MSVTRFMNPQDGLSLTSMGRRATYGSDFFFHRHDVVVLLFLSKRWWEKEKKEEEKGAGDLGWYLKVKQKKTSDAPGGVRTFFFHPVISTPFNRHDHSWQMTRWRDQSSRLPLAMVPLTHLAKGYHSAFFFLPCEEWNIEKVHSPFCEFNLRASLVLFLTIETFFFSNMLFIEGGEGRLSRE
jgi:hypothetical protein